MITFGAPRIEEDEIRAVVRTLRSGWISKGPRATDFETAFRRYERAKFAVSVNSCTAALHLALVAAGIGEGDEVITTPLTFCATANVVMHVGAKPVFADVKRSSMNIDPEAIRKSITRRTRAVIPVHLAGRPCEMQAILSIARKHKLTVISDCAHAIEATYHGTKVGSIGDVAVFSFYATKNLTTGEGGMITTNHSRLARVMALDSLHGLSRHAWQRYSNKRPIHYSVVRPGFKYNMTDIQAAMGLKQLEKIERYLKIRERIWAQYDEAFASLPVVVPAPAEHATRHARHLYTLLLNLEHLRKSRDEIRVLLLKEGIGTGVHFVTLHLEPLFKRVFGYRRGDFPNAEWISERTLSLPLSAKLTPSEVRRVIAAVTRVIRKVER